MEEQLARIYEHCHAQEEKVESPYNRRSRSSHALSKWEFEPTLLNEKPVSVQLVMTIRFRLK